MSDLLYPQPGIDLDSIYPIDDGSPVPEEYQFLPSKEKLQEDLDNRESDFNENIAELLSESELTSLATKLIEDIESDIASRSQWSNTISKSIKYLGFKLEEFKDTPFMRACGAYDNTMAAATLKAWAVARAELFPMQGPASAKILGAHTDDKIAQNERMIKFLNTYLTYTDKEYYEDSDSLIWYAVFCGSAFRKVYQDPIINRPVARFIKPQDFIINNNTTSILASSRLTHQDFLTKKEILLLQKSGFYRQIKLPSSYDNMDDTESKIATTIKEQEGIETDSDENKNLFKIYECHVDLEPFRDAEKKFSSSDKEDHIPIPYIVTICSFSKKIFSIRRNWAQGDESFKRVEYFVGYKYLPGFGLYGTGIAHLCSSNALVATSILRQLIDAGLLKNFPGGICSKGMKIENNDKAIGPSTFVQVENGDMPLAQSIMLMPYAEPSLVLKDLLTYVTANMQNLADTAGAALSENRPDAPVGTTLALLENAHIVQSSVLRNMHVALSRELNLIFDLFAKHLGDTPYPFSIAGEDSVIMRTDFNENVRVIPVSDPNITTSTQRIIRAEALLKLANSAPQIHNIREAYHRMYKVMNVEDIDKLLPEPVQAVPLDPITEIMNAINNKPIVAAMWQDHPAHIMVKNQKMQELAQSNPQSAAALAANIAEHTAMQYVLDMQVQMGIQLPPLQELQDPNVQNEIAMKAAEVAHQKMQEQQQQQQAQMPPDPNTVMMADIQQKQEAAILKDKSDKLKAETEAFKAQLKYESDEHKMELQREMAEMKNEVMLAIAGMKQEEATEKAEDMRENYNEEGL